MTFEKIFVVKKLEQLAAYTKELEELLELDDSQLLLSRNLHAAERLVQLAADTMIDINQHFIRELNFQVPDELRGTFIMMGENEILPKKFAEKIAPLAGIRNILVHQYDDLDKNLFLRNLRNNFSDFKEYQKHIYEYLKQLGG